MQVLVEVGSDTSSLEWVVKEIILRLKHVVEGSGREILLEKYGENTGADTFVDVAGVGLTVIQNKKMAGTDGDLPTVHFVPFFAREDRLE